MNYSVFLIVALSLISNCWALAETNPYTNKVTDYQKLLPELANVAEIQFGEWEEKSDITPNIRLFISKRSITDKYTIQGIVACLTQQLPVKTKIWFTRSYPVLFLDKSGNVILGLGFDPDSDPKYAFHYCGFKSSKEYGYIWNHDPGWSKGGMLIHCKQLADIIESAVIHKGEHFGEIPTQ